MATEWPNISLGEVVEIRHGFAFKSKFFTDTPGPIVLTPGNFREEGGFTYKNPEKFYCGPIPDRYILSPGDLLVVMTEQKAGLLGSAALVPATGTFLHNQRLGLVMERAPERIHRRFLYYLFNSPHVRQQIQATANGTKVRHTSPDRLKEVQVCLPPLAIQERIASILAAYDELIENNLRRIDMLEDMAQALYREWFVEFRSSLLQQIEIVSSEHGPIPKGWRVVPYGTIADEVKDGVDPQDVDPQTTYVGLEHLPRQSFTMTESGFAYEVSSRKWRFRQGDILFGRLRPYFHKVALAWDSGISSTDIIVIRPKPGMEELALQVAFSPEFVGHAVATSGGTDRPRAQWKDMAKFPVVLPPDPVLLRFAELVRPLIDLAQNLARQNVVLRQSVDLLLPKLVSGEIDVSDLDIDTDWLVA